MSIIRRNGAQAATVELQWQRVFSTAKSQWLGSCGSTSIPLMQLPSMQQHAAAAADPIMTPAADSPFDAHDLPVQD
jgi:hypothetical protein